MKTTRHVRKARRRKPVQLAIAVIHPSTDFEFWRSGLKEYLERTRGKKTRLARMLHVTRSNIHDWFTAKRCDCPGWVTFALATTPEQFFIPQHQVIKELGERLSQGKVRSS